MLICYVELRKLSTNACEGYYAGHYDWEHMWLSYNHVCMHGEDSRTGCYNNVLEGSVLGVILYTYIKPNPIIPKCLLLYVYFAYLHSPSSLHLLIEVATRIYMVDYNICTFIKKGKQKEDVQLESTSIGNCPTKQLLRSSEYHVSISNRSQHFLHLVFSSQTFYFSLIFDLIQIRIIGLDILYFTFSLLN